MKDAKKKKRFIKLPGYMLMVAALMVIALSPAFASPNEDTALLQAAVRKMKWHETRQKVLSQNVSNADTVGYKPNDINPLDFKSLLGSSSSGLSLTAATTNNKHMTMGKTPITADKFSVTQQKDTYEVSPSGNAVVLEEQLLKLNENYADHQLTTTIYQKNIDMLKRATRTQ